MAEEIRDTPPEHILSVDQALTEIFGIHSGWALVLEGYDEDGKPVLITAYPGETPRWNLVGMARALTFDLEYPLSRIAEGDD